MAFAVLSFLKEHFAQMAQNDRPRLITAVVLLVALFALAGPHRVRRARGSFILLVLYLLLMGVRELFEADTEAAEALRLIGVFLLLSSIGRSLFLLTTQTVFRASADRLPKIFLDVVHGLVYVVALMFTLREAGVTPGSLLTGSAVLTGIIGLSMKDTLGNIFAGLAIQAQRPFEVGDWIQFDTDPSHIGKVSEINWRAATVVTLDQVEVVIPNARLADNIIVNFTRPRRYARRSIYFLCPYDVPPQRVHAIVLQAVAGAWGVLDDPPPSIVTLGFESDGLKYWVRFFTVELDRRDGVDGNVRDRIWYALARHGIHIPFPQRTVHMHDPAGESQSLREQSERERRLETLCCVDFFTPLGEEALARLAAMARTRLYAADEAIIRQGDPGQELFVIQRGEVAVSLERPGESAVELARLGPRHFFGEMSLLTGEPRTATARATRETELVVVDKAAMAQVLANHPELCERISHVVASRRADLQSKRELATAPADGDGQEWGTRLLRRIREFFNI
jgi:small-conductance mechanosensitive channel/CRP-like cAMP-binding protein